MHSRLGLERALFMTFYNDGKKKPPVTSSIAQARFQFNKNNNHLSKGTWAVATDM